MRLFLALVVFLLSKGNIHCDRSTQARNQDFMWGGANEAKVDRTTEMFFFLIFLMETSEFCNFFFEFFKFF